MEDLATATELRKLIFELTKADVTQVGPSEDLMDTLGLDSLSGLRLLALVEKKFSVRFQDEELTSLRSIEALVLAILRARSVTAGSKS